MQASTSLIFSSALTKPGIAPQAAPLFMGIGMHCLGCPASQGETVEEACMVHGIEVEKLLALVNEEANKKAE